MHTLTQKEKNTFHQLQNFILLHLFCFLSRLLNIHLFIRQNTSGSFSVLEHATVWGYDHGLEAAVVEETQQTCSQEQHCGLNSEPGQVPLVAAFCFVFIF